MFNLETYNSDFEKILEHYKKDISTIRTNRATPALVEDIPVDVYGSKMPVVQLASINISDPRTLIVEPWDKNVGKDIERAIQSASIGLSVSNEGNFLRLIVPTMTEETRKEIIKLLNDKTEGARSVLRQLRDKIKEEINKQEKNKDLSEDEKYKAIENLDKKTKMYQEKLMEVEHKKEEEIKI